MPKIFTLKAIFGLMTSSRFPKNILVASFFLHFFLNLFSDAQVLNIPQPKHIEQTDWSGGFIDPNEKGIKDLKPIMKTIQPGIIVSIGSERALFDYLLAPEGSFLIAVDVDPLVIRYNKMILALIKASDNFSEFRRARTQQIQKKMSLSDKKFWDQLFSKMDQTEVDLFKSSPNARGRLGVQWLSNFQFYHDPMFDEVNYVLNENLFWKLKRNQDWLQTSFLDITDMNQIRSLLEESERAGLKISLFDFSNALDFVEMKSEQIEKMIALFKTYKRSQNTTLMLSKVSYDRNGHYSMYSLDLIDDHQKIGALSRIIKGVGTQDDSRQLKIPNLKYPFFPPTLNHKIIKFKLCSSLF